MALMQFLSTCGTPMAMSAWPLDPLPEEPRSSGELSFPDTVGH